MIYCRGKQLINQFPTQVSSWRLRTWVILNIPFYRNPIATRKPPRPSTRFLQEKDSRDRKKYEKEVWRPRIRGILRKDDESCLKKEKGRMEPNINRVETHASLARWTRNADQYTAIMHRMRRNNTVIRRGFAFFVVSEHFLSADVNLKNVPRISFEIYGISSTSRNSRTVLHSVFSFKDKNGSRVNY